LIYNEPVSSKPANPRRRVKPAAAEHIAKMRALIGILETNGYHVSQITTDRPGYVVFEDDHQVVAEPFRGEKK